MYFFLDTFFFIFHSILIFSIIFGWIWKKTRKINLICILLTAFSWFFLGIWYGFGYCPSTDWHWQVRLKMGHTDMPASYIKFLLESITGLELNSRMVDAITLVVFLFALTASVLMNLRDKRKKVNS